MSPREHKRGRLEGCCATTIAAASASAADDERICIHKLHGANKTALIPRLRRARSISFRFIPFHSIRFRSVRRPVCHAALFRFVSFVWSRAFVCLAAAAADKLPTAAPDKSPPPRWSRAPPVNKAHSERRFLLLLAALLSLLDSRLDDWQPARAREQPVAHV